MSLEPPIEVHGARQENMQVCSFVNSPHTIQPPVSFCEAQPPLWAVPLILQYPEANVCFHQIYLPEHHKSKEELRQGLLDAFKNGEHNLDPFGRK